MLKHTVTAISIGLLVVFLYVMQYTGAFKSVTLGVDQRGPYTLIYKDYIGPYYKIVSTIQEVEKWAQDNGLKCRLSFGEYFDNPDIVEEGRLKARGGCLVDPLDENEIKTFTTLKDKLPPDFKTDIYAQTKAAVALFTGAAGIGPMKVYPKAEEFMAKGNLHKKGPVLEIYEIFDKKSMQTIYIWPIQECGRGQSQELFPAHTTMVLATSLTLEDKEAVKEKIKKGPFYVERKQIDLENHQYCIASADGAGATRKPIVTFGSGIPREISGSSVSDRITHVVKPEAYDHAKKEWLNKHCEELNHDPTATAKLRYESECEVPAFHIEAVVESVEHDTILRLSCYLNSTGKKDIERSLSTKFHVHEQDKDATSLHVNEVVPTAPAAKPVQNSL